MLPEYHLMGGYDPSTGEARPGGRFSELFSKKNH